MKRIFVRAAFVAAYVVLAPCAPKPAEVPETAPSPPLTGDARERAARAVHADPVATAAAVSRYRAAHGLSGVTPDPTLQTSARPKADAMAKQNLLSHEIAGSLTKRFDA